MGQAAVDLPDPSQVPNAPVSSADDLLSQLASDEIDRLLAEAEAEKGPVEQPGQPLPADDPETSAQLDELFNDLSAQNPEEVAPAGRAPSTIDPPASVIEKPEQPAPPITADAPAPVPAVETSPAEPAPIEPEPAQLNPAEPAPAEPAPVQPAPEPVQSAPPQPTAEVSPAPVPAVVAKPIEPPPDQPEPVDQPTPADLVVSQAATPDAPASESSAIARELDEALANRSTDALPEVKALQATEVETSNAEKSALTDAIEAIETTEPPAIEEPPLPIYLKPLVWLNAPMNALPEETRDALGKIAIMTLANAIAVMGYVLLFRHHHH